MSNKLENLTVNEGEQDKFTVKVGGKPKPFVKWFKDDVEIVIDESAEIIETEEEFSFIIMLCVCGKNSVWPSYLPNERAQQARILGKR